MTLMDDILAQSKEELKSYLWYSRLADDAHNAGMHQTAMNLRKIADDEHQHSLALSQMYWHPELGPIPTEEQPPGYEAEEVIRKMRREGKEWSDVTDWITRQVGYSPDVVEWARKIYYGESSGVGSPYDYNKAAEFIAKNVPTIVPEYVGERLAEAEETVESTFGTPWITDEERTTALTRRTRAREWIKDTAERYGYRGG